MMMLFQKNIRKYVDRQDLPYVLLLARCGSPQARIQDGKEDTGEEE